jgi:hypothetical protein
MSPDGRWLVFSSTAGNLVPGVRSDGTDPNVFRKNLGTGAIGLAVKTTGGPPDGFLTPAGVSDSGAVVAFEGSATNISGIAPDGSLRDSAYLRDVTTGRVRRLLYEPAGAPSQGSTNASVSADGTRAAFVGLDSDGFEASVLACKLPAGLAADPSCTLVASAFPVFDLHLAAGGTALEFSAANTPAAASRWEVFSVGFGGGTASPASVSNAGDVAGTDTGNGGGIQGISGDGRTVFFSSSATNLVPGVADRQVHAYVRT